MKQKLSLQHADRRPSRIADRALPASMVRRSPSQPEYLLVARVEALEDRLVMPLLGVFHDTICRPGRLSTKPIKTPKITTAFFEHSCDPNRVFRRVHVTYSMVKRFVAVALLVKEYTRSLYRNLLSNRGEVY